MSKEKLTDKSVNSAIDKEDIKIEIADNQSNANIETAKNMKEVEVNKTGIKLDT